MDDHLELGVKRAPRLPVVHDRQRADDEVRARPVEQVGERGRGLAEAHVVGEAAAEAESGRGTAATTARGAGTPHCGPARRVTAPPPPPPPPTPAGRRPPTPRPLAGRRPDRPALHPPRWDRLPLCPPPRRRPPPATATPPPRPPRARGEVRLASRPRSGAARPGRSAPSGGRCAAAPVPAASTRARSASKSGVPSTTASQSTNASLLKCPCDRRGRGLTCVPRPKARP